METTNPETEMVRLRNGSEEPRAVVVAMMRTVSMLMQSTKMLDTLAIYDLARAAHDSTYDLSFTRSRLASLSLLDASGRMHTSIKNIAASSLTVEGTAVVMVDPEAS